MADSVMRPTLTDATMRAAAEAAAAVRTRRRRGGAEKDSAAHASRVTADGLF
jgi:hypothetical protein